MSNEEMVMQIAAGDEAQIVDLWLQFAKYVRAKAFDFFLVRQDRCMKLGIEVDDLYQEGYFAFLRAVKAFDPALGKPFISLFAYSLKTQFFMLAKMTHSNWACNKINDCESLDSILDAVGDAGYNNALLDEGADYGDVEEKIYWEAISPIIADALETLTPRQRQIITALYYKEKTFEAAAQQYGISKGAVEIHKNAALKKLRRNAKLIAACAY